MNNDTQTTATTVDPLGALDAADQNTPKPKASTRGTATIRTPKPEARHTTSQQYAPTVAAQLWPVSAYLRVSGSGAIKLHKSGVAPLVAAARGYLTANKDTVKVVAEKFGVGSLGSGMGKVLNDAAKVGDALMMPWLSLPTVAEAAHRKVPAPFTIEYQFRPSRPITLPKAKKPSKYLFPKGMREVLDLHPATPYAWVTDAPRVMLPEGLLKADAALTGMLRAAGVTNAELADSTDLDTDGARAALAALMDRVPEDDRILIVGLAGSGNWHNSADWDGLRLHGREVIIGLDADVATNPNVWSQASKLFKKVNSKRAEGVTLLAVPPVMDEDGNLDRKAGLDDWLAAGGDWTQIPELLDELPEAPEYEKPETEAHAVVDMDNAVTYVTETRDLEDGNTGRVRVALAEAAVKITGIETNREIHEGLMEEVFISGDLSWQSRPDSGPNLVEHTKFRGVNSKLLRGSKENAVDFLTDASRTEAGAAAGAYTVADARIRKVAAAWGAGMATAARSTKIRYCGFLEWKGQFGYLTADGLRLRDSYDTAVRSDLGEGRPAVQIPLLPADPHARTAKITRAWEAFQRAYAAFHPAQRGIIEVLCGQNVTLSSLGVQAQGTPATFGEPGTGKTMLLQMMGGWNGPKWQRAEVLELRGTEAYVRGLLEGFNDGALPLDDASDFTDNMQKSQRTIDKSAAVQEKVTDLVTLGYAPAVSSGKRVMTASGRWINEPGMPNACRATMINGENLESIGLSRSRGQRALAFTITKDIAPLGHKDALLPARDTLADGDVLPTLRAAIFEYLHYLAELNRVRRPELEGRALWTIAGQELAEQATRDLRGAEPRLTGRDAEFLGPVLAGWTALVNAVEHAGLEVPEHLTRDEAMRSILLAWRRSMAEYRSTTNEPHAKYLAAIAELVALGRYKLEGGGMDVLGRLTTSGKNAGSLVILPGRVTAALSGTFKGIEREDLERALSGVIESKKASIRFDNGHVPSGWRIKAEAWSDAIKADGASDDAEVWELDRDPESVSAWFTARDTAGAMPPATPTLEHLAGILNRVSALCDPAEPLAWAEAVTAAVAPDSGLPRVSPVSDLAAQLAADLDAADAEPYTGPDAETDAESVDILTSVDHSSDVALRAVTAASGPLRLMIRATGHLRDAGAIGLVDLDAHGRTLGADDPEMLANVLTRGMDWARKESAGLPPLWPELARPTVPEVEVPEMGYSPEVEPMPELAELGPMPELDFPDMD